MPRHWSLGRRKGGRQKIPGEEDIVVSKGHWLTEKHYSKKHSLNTESGSRCEVHNVRRRGPLQISRVKARVAIVNTMGGGDYHHLKEEIGERQKGDTEEMSGDCVSMGRNSRFVHVNKRKHQQRTPMPLRLEKEKRKGARPVIRYWTMQCHAVFAGHAKHRHRDDLRYAS